LNNKQLKYIYETIQADPDLTPDKVKSVNLESHLLWVLSVYNAKLSKISAEGFNPQGVQDVNKTAGEMIAEEVEEYY
jgi:hypothetical protein